MLLPDCQGTLAASGLLWPGRTLLLISALNTVRLLMVRVSAATGSLLLMNLVHESFTGSQGILQPATTPAGYFPCTDFSPTFSWGWLLSRCWLEERNWIFLLRYLGNPPEYMKVGFDS
jgi:hypothetical protein